MIYAGGLLNRRGMTLVELAVAIAIISILTVVLGYEYTGWIGGYKIENEAKEIHGVLLNARARALQRNRTHFGKFPTTTSFSIYEDTNPGPDGDKTLQDSGTNRDTLLPGFPKTLNNAVTWDGGGNVTFERSGMIDPDGTMRITYDAGKYSPDYDCIKLSQTRIAIGKWGDCDDDSGTADDCCAK